MALIITSPHSADAYVGIPFEYQIVAEGGVEPYEYHIHSPLTWESIDEETGLITGTPTVVEEKVMTLEVHDSGQPGSRVIVLFTVSVGLPTLGPARWQSGDTHLPGFQAGQKEN